MRGPSEAMADMLVGNGVVAEADKSLYSYGLHQLGMTILNAATALVIGAALGLLWQSVLFLAAYIPLRRCAGGYHAGTELGCYVTSSLLVLIALLIIGVVPARPALLLPLVALSGAVIVTLAPVDSANKPLDSTEYQVYRGRGRGILAVHWGVVLVAVALSAYEIVSIIMIADMVLALLLSLGWVKNRVEGKIAK